MNVFYLRSNPVDPDSRVEKEINTLINSGKSVTVFAWDRSGNYKIKKEMLFSENKNVYVYRKGIKSQFGSGFKKNLIPLLRFQMSILYFLTKNRKEIDVIHAADFDTGLAAAIFTIFNRNKFVYDIFDFYTDSFSVPGFLKKTINKMEYFVIKQSDATIICTQDRLNQIDGSKPKRLEIIHNSPPKLKKPKKSNKFKKEIDTQDKARLVYVGVLGGARMIKEIVDIAVETNLFEFHIAGFGPYESYLADKSKKYSNIKFYGKINYHDALLLSESADFLTALYDPKVPNHKFAAPNKFYEALMLGKPLIMARGTGMSQYLEKHNIGVVIDYNKNDLAEGIKKIISDYVNSEQVSETAKKLYSTQFDWEIMSERLINLYNEI